MDYDILVTNGTLIDGSGAPRRKADVAIKDGLIVAIGSCEGSAGEIIDASGLVITPGFIDLHTHYDGQISWDDELAPSCYHGVTTIVMGNCGVGFAPVKPEDRDRLVALMEGVEDIPGTALHEGLTWDWESLPEYMAALDSRPHTIDFAVQATHDPLRVHVMGDRALADQPATDEDIERMKRLTREALLAGAVGFSTGRTDNHRDTSGAVTPASEATARELRGIAEAFVGLKHGVISAVSDFDMNDAAHRFDPEFDLLEAMIDASGGRPMSISLMQRDQDSDQWKRILARAEQAAAAGKPIRVQVAARGIGVLLGLQATFHPFMGYPSYKRIAHLPLEERVAHMHDVDFKTQLLSEKTEKVTGDGSPLPPLADVLLQHIEFVAARMYRMESGFDYEPEYERSLYAQASAQGIPVLEALYDAMLEEDGKQLLCFPIYNYLEQNLDNVHTMLTHPLALPGLSDGGAHVGTICDASFPTYMITHWTRDRRRGPRLELERTIQMMTHDVAEHMGFSDRGLIAAGRKADLNVFDAETLLIERPYMVEDLPAGGRRLLQRARGYRATIVSGQIVIDRDELTDARPGRLVRLGQ
ncbi:MAG: amidohydrolase family protein [Bradymonadaceae bacterium]|nr:amidohydrolase family protein [Lujinxingiaceae bacterium]